MKILLLLLVCFTVGANAQNSIASDFVEGGKTIVELIRVIKTPKTTIVPAAYNNPDSCGIKKLADISFKNKTDKPVQVILYLRIGNGYENIPHAMSISPSTQESLYELKAGIYKYVIQTDAAGQKTTLHEGELKLQPCEKSVKEIKW
jgi:hypothetical protein